jgi:flavin reductase (DIM6/NTAB) family NADH-FMN oxidoreductase RutF
VTKAVALNERFRLGMRRLAAGVAIVTTRHDGGPRGLTVTALCSLSIDPPQLLVCVNRQADAHDPMIQSRRFCVNLLGQRHRALAARFAGLDGIEGEARFESGRWAMLATGAPVLEDALASFDCAVSQVVDAATHTIFIGRVVDVRARRSGAPLLYAAGTFTALAQKAPARARKNR